MKLGDFVRKVHGVLHKGKIGLVLYVNTNSMGNTIVRVLSDGEIRNWYGNYVEVVNENA